MLFKGKHCFPLSPNPELPAGGQDEADQLRVILKFLGAPDKHSLSFVQSSGTLEHLAGVCQGLPEQAASLLANFQTELPDLDDLLKSMLEFNPCLRPSASELLSHKFFDDIRVADNEASSDKKLRLDVDSDEHFDLDSCNFKFTDEELITKIYSKLQEYKH